MQKNVFETLVGAVVISLAAFFLFFAYTNSSSRSPSTGTKYQAKFDRVDGLIIGSDVRISGVKTGSIQDIKIDPKTFQATIVFIINADLKLPQDSSAEIISDGIMGGKYFAIIPGGDDLMLKENDFVKFTQSSVSLEAMIGQLIFNAKDEKKENTSKS